MLVVYNLKNGVSMVKANGYNARVSNGDAGQQWVLDRESFSSTSQPFMEALTIEVIDRDGAGDGIEYFLLLDTEAFDADCASGLNASPAPVLGELIKLQYRISHSLVALLLSHCSCPCSGPCSGRQV